jgi:hypothetical protein
MTAEEGLKLQTMLNAQRFPDAEAYITKLEPVWLEESTNNAKASLQVSRSDAVQKLMVQVQVLTSENKLDQALDALDLAIALGGETDQALFLRLKTARRAGNCPAVIAAADALVQQYPDSSLAKQAVTYKKPCLASPAIGPIELKRAIAARKADIDGCLKTPLSPDHVGTTIDVAWTVSTTGTVTAASCTTPALAKSPLCECLTQQVKQLRFSEKPGVQARRGAFTFTPGTSG